MSSSDVGWVEAYGENANGVDHLGMRVAAEAAYAKLIDFTTTVTWRPRYFSFFCWALERAFCEAGGVEDQTDNTLEVLTWRHALRRREYALAAASRRATPGAQNIAGSDKITKALNGALPTGSVDFVADHLQATLGGFDLYNGPMRRLRLLRTLSSDGGKLFYRPSHRGARLADAFAQSLAASGASAALDGTRASLAELDALGAYCALSGLSSGALQYPAVQAERDALRQAVVDWAEFGGGDERGGHRIFTIGIILDLHRRLEGIDVTLDVFREATLFGAVRRASETRSLELPPTYERALVHWRVYQAHAFATFALEALLAVVLDHALVLQGDRDDGWPYRQLLSSVIDMLPAGASHRAAGPLPQGLTAWWEMPVSELKERLTASVRAGVDADIREPDLCRGAAKASRVDAPAERLHEAALLLMLSVRRLALLIDDYGTGAWLGEEAPNRLPPAFLVQHLEKCASVTARDYLLRCLDECVVRQHLVTALRKLAAVPSKNTAKLAFIGDRLIPLIRHVPGTSNPRFDNAVEFLRDLGYLAEGTPVVPTQDGLALLERIAREAA